MPTYRLKLLQADSVRVEGIHTVLRGTAYVMGRPREVVVPTRVTDGCSSDSSTKSDRVDVSVGSRRRK